MVEGTYHVYTAEGLKAWVSNPNVQSTNCTLEDDIELEEEWEPISSYAGIFDGQGHTISGLRATGTGQFVSMANGMFGEIQQGCVKDLRLENPVVTRLKDFGYGDLIPLSVNNGAIVGSLKFGGQIIGCTVSNATISGSTAGGIVGSTSSKSGGSGGTITGCAVINSQITGGTVGGIAGIVLGSTAITGCCSVDGTITANLGNYAKGGGIAGGKNPNTLTTKACYWNGNATEGIGGDPTYSGVTKVDGNTATWSKAIQDMERASDCQFEVDASGKPTGVG